MRGAITLLGLLLLPGFMGGVLAEPAESDGSGDDGAASAIPAPAAAVLHDARDVRGVLERSAVRLLSEGFETATALAELGWSEEDLTNQRRNATSVWHVDERDPVRVMRGERTAIVAAGNRSASISTGDSYPTFLDHRLVSPAIDLRYVSGASVRPDDAYDGTMDPARPAPASLAGVVALLDSLLVDRIATSRNQVLSRFAFLGDWFTTRPGDVPLAGSPEGAGYVNLSFRHHYDFAPGHGGFVEVRARPGPGAEWGAWAPLSGDLLFETTVDWVALATEAPVCRGDPLRTGTRNYQQISEPARSALKDICHMDQWHGRHWNATSSTDPETGRARPGSSPTGSLDPSVEQGGSLPTVKIGSPNPYGRSYRSPVTVTDLTELLLHGAEPEPYTGHIAGTPAFTGRSHRDGIRPLDQPVVGDSAAPGSDTSLAPASGVGVVKSVFTLNRFIGTEIQIAFRVTGSAARFEEYRGWFIDDVAVHAVVPETDAAATRADTPFEGDTRRPGTPFVPAIEVGNLGRVAVDEVHVDYRIRSGSGATEWASEANVSRVRAQERMVVPADRAWTPDHPGEYILDAWVNATTDPGADTVLAPRRSENDRIAVPFTVAAIDRYAVGIRIPDASIQTDVGVAKSFVVSAVNRGNAQIGGRLDVAVTRWNSTADAAAGEPIPLDPVESAFIEARDLPYGTDLVADGSTANRVARNYTWPEPAEVGVYRITARFVAGDARFDAVPAFFFVRETPPPYFEAGFETMASTPDEFPVPPRSVLRLNRPGDHANGTGWTTRGHYNTGDPEEVVSDDGEAFPATRAHYPPALGGRGVWEATGRDGRMIPSSRAASVVAPPENLAAYWNSAFDLADITGTVAEQSSYRRNSNLFDTYPLEVARDIRIPAGVDAAALSFWQWSGFRWTDGSTKDESRGFVCIASVAEEAWLRDLPGCLPPGTDPGIKWVRDGVIVAVYDSATDWQQTTVDLLPFAGRDVRVQFILETSPARHYTDDHEGTSPEYCRGGNPVSVMCADLKAGQRQAPWLVDEIRIAHQEASGRIVELFRDGAEGNDRSPTRGSLAAFTNCGPERDRTRWMCRGWNATYLPEAYPGGWHVEDRNGYVPEGGLDENPVALRWGIPFQEDYGMTAYHHDGASVGAGCADKDADVPTSCYMYGVAATPPFRIVDAARPVLTFRTAYQFYPVTEYADTVCENNTAGGRYMRPNACRGSADAATYGSITFDGGNVWIVGRNADGAEVVKDLVVPKGGYDARLATHSPVYRYTDPQTLEESVRDDKGQRTRFFSLPEFHLMNTRYESLDRTVFTGTSGRGAGDVGPPRWVLVEADLSPYVEEGLRELTYTLEFHATRQQAKKQATMFGWRVDDVRIAEATRANDVALVDMAMPAAGAVLGPGMQVPIIVRVANEGLFPQRGINVTYAIFRVEGADRVLVHGPVTEFTGFLTGDDAIPGSLAPAAEDRTRLLIFGKTWTVPELEQGAREARYVIHVETNLARSILPFKDDEPANDRFTRDLVVRRDRSSRLAGEDRLPTPHAVSPAIAPSGTPRSFRAIVENIGTLAEVYDHTNPGEMGRFRVVVDQEDEAGRPVLAEPLVREIPFLAAGDSLDVTWPNGWTPTASGRYTITFRLEHPNETILGDNTRSVIHEVYDRIIRADGTPPAPGTDTARFITDGHFRADDAAGWTTRAPDAEAYPSDLDARLSLDRDVNLRSLRQAYVRVNHTYDLEEGFDGGVLEVSTDEGRTWTVLAPDGDHPVRMTTASPLVEDPVHAEGAFSGDSQGARHDTFNLGRVRDLATHAVLFADTFDENEYPQIAGNWTESSFVVRPPTGKSVWFSNKTVFSCNGDSINQGALARNGNGEYYGDAGREVDCMFERMSSDRAMNVKKYLNFSLDLSDVPADPGARIIVSYWDWRAIGIQYQDVAGVPVIPMDPNGVSVEICCATDDPFQPRSVVPKSRSLVYDDNYRDWTRNEIAVTNILPQLVDRDDVRLSFVHHVANGKVLQTNPRLPSFSSRPSYLDTDIVSPHIGWAIDDVEVSVMLSDGTVIPVLADAIDYGSLGDARDAGFDIRGSYMGIEHANGDPQKVQLVHVGPNRVTWDVVPGLFGDRTWSLEPVTGRGTVAFAEVRNDTASLIMGGNAARLVSRLDLKSAVGNVTLSMDHAHKFTEAGFDAKLGPVSGGRVEVSTDQGRTWHPVDPIGGYVDKPRRVEMPHGLQSLSAGDGVRPTLDAGGPAAAAHTLFGTDPEGNSPYGPGGRVFWGRTERTDEPGKPPISYAYDWRVHNYWKHDTFDLSAYAGQETWIAFHAAFGTSRPVHGYFDPRVERWSDRNDFWAIDNVVVTADVFDGTDARIRLRAAGDGNGEAAGWDVHDVELLGVKHLVNAAARIVSPVPGTPIISDPRTPLHVEVVNTGQEPLRNVVVRVQTRHEAPEPQDGIHVDVEGPLTDYEPCPGSTIRTDGTVPPSSAVRLCGFRGDLLEFFAQAGVPYALTAKVFHADVGLEVVVADNGKTTHIPPPLPHGRILIRDMTVSPNAWDPRSNLPLVVEVELVNEGAPEAFLGGLTATFGSRDTERPHAPHRLSLAQAMPAVSPVFRSAGESRVYRWTLTPDAVDGWPEGFYAVEVEARTRCASGCSGETAETATRVLHLGQDYYSRNIDNGRQHTSGGSAVLKGRGPDDAACPDRDEWRTCSMIPEGVVGVRDPLTWFSALDMMNHSAPYALGIDAATPALLCPGSEAPEACPSTVRGQAALVSPVMSLDNTFAGGASSKRAFLTYWERIDASPGQTIRVLARPVVSHGWGGIEVDAPTDGVDHPWIEVVSLNTTSTDGFAQGAFVPRQFDLAAAFREGHAGNPAFLDSYDGVQVAFVVHYPSGRPFRGWFIDDITLSPFGFALTPRQEVVTTDDTDKRYRYVIENRGGFSDRYAVSVGDTAAGRPVPPDWVVSASRYREDRGVIEVYDARGDGGRCDPLAATYRGEDPDAPVVRATGIALDPGERVTVDVRVCIPVSESRAGQTGATGIPIRVESLAIPDAVAEDELGVSFRHLERANLVIDPTPGNGLRINNPALPVNQPRSVDVVVHNTGSVPARGVLVAVLASPDPSTGGANETLSRFDGSPVAPVAIIPPGEARTVTLLWTPRTVGAYTLTATADPADALVELREDDNVAVTGLVIHRPTFPDLEVRATVDNLQPNAGDRVEVSLAVTNHGGVAATGIQLTYKVGVTDLLPTRPYFLPTALQPGDTVYVNRTWTAIFPGRILLFASAIPRGGVLERVATQDDNQAVVPLLVRSLGLDMAVDSAGVTLDTGSAARVPFTVGNGGETPDSYRFRVDAPPPLGAHLERDGRRVHALPLVNGTGAALTLVIDAPIRIPAGTYPVTVIGVSENTTQTRTVELPVHIRPRYDIAVDPVILQAKPGAVTVPVPVRNAGNAYDAVTLTLAGSPRPGWSAREATGTIAPYSRGEIPWTIDVPTGESQGTYDVVIRATSSSGLEAFTRGSITIDGLARMTAAFPDGVTPTRAHREFRMNATLSNDGNMRAQANLRVTGPDGWDVRVAGAPEVVLEPGETATVAVAVVVPAAAVPGDHAIVLHVRGVESARDADAIIRVLGSDLRFDDVDYAPRVNLVAGTTVLVNATVQNDGALDAADVDVAFYVDDELLGFETLGRVPAGGGVAVGFPWVAQTGSHSVVLVVDPGRGILESDENNNARLLDIAVATDDDWVTAAQRSVPGVDTGMAVLVGVLMAMLVTRLRDRRRIGG